MLDKLEAIVVYPKSTNVSFYSYTPKDKELIVKFIKTPGAYAYKEVPDNVFLALMGAESAGKFICANIKDKYGWEKINPVNNSSAAGLREKLDAKESTVI